MAHQVQLSDVISSGVVAVVRKVPFDLVVPLTEALLKGGVQTIEITLDSPDAIHSIETVKKRFAHAAKIGAGTVLDAQSAQIAIAAGAEFVISPNLDIATIEMTKRLGKIAIPGVMTPTEMVTARQNGADAVKIFPAGVLGPDYLRDVRGPLGHIPIMVTGGITLDNAAAFITRGAAAIGVGSSLFNKRDLAEKDFAKITETAKQYGQTVKMAKAQMERGFLEGLS